MNVYPLGQELIRVSLEIRCRTPVYVLINLHEPNARMKRWYACSLMP